MQQKSTLLNSLVRSIAGVIVCLTGGLALAQHGTLLVANRVGGSVSFFDLAAGLEVARVPIGPRIPHEVHVSPDGRLALTAEYGPNGDPGRHVVVIDVAAAQITGRIDLGPNSRPHTALFLPDSRHAVATMQDSDQLALLDIDELSVVRTYPTGGREGHMVRLSPDGSRAYVTSRGAEGTLSVIFLDENRPPEVIDTGRGAEGLDVTSDGAEIWVANRDNETVSVVSAESFEVIDTLAMHPYAGRIDIGADGLAAMPNGRNGVTPVPQMLQIWNVADRNVVAEYPIRDGNPGNGNFGVLVHNGHAYVSDPGEGTIQVIAMDGSGERSTLATGHEGPDGIDWSPVRINAMSVAAEPRF